ncbi:uncharacterized protein DNG_03818 [Cephalotrichum gorgonifer]|uniref:Uncharacterized protein n=1 Tax=Cephalotrichum gorgonifer TaxID=2041049 RepID=A0AAE8MUV0_9PEZI|nr:uncharacterized protein DNG_03818 [Cephalotrichum gorgonifer]
MANQLPFTLTYQKKGTRPPIFVAGTFTDPPWEPQEMEYSTGGDGELTFSKTGVLEEGADVQYKFRVGTGDCDNDYKTLLAGQMLTKWLFCVLAEDVHGNINNVMKVALPVSDQRHCPAIENDSGARPPLTPTTPNTSEGGASNIYQTSTTNLIADLENEHRPSRTTSAEATSAYSSTRVEGTGTHTESERTHVDSEIRRRTGSAKPTTRGDDASLAKAGRRPWIVRILHKLWFEVIGGFFRRIFRGRRPE